MSIVDLYQLVEDLSRTLEAQARLGGHYRHPSGVGDDREAAVIKALRNLLPSTYGIAKGKIFDSRGSLSDEFDVIVYEESQSLTALSIKGRQVVPAEAVRGVIEVKSKLDKKGYCDAMATIASLDPLRRSYRLVDQRLTLDSTLRDRLQAGLNMTERFPGIPRSWAVVVALDTVGSRTLAGYLEKWPPPAAVPYFCTIGKELVIRQLDPPGFIGIPFGHQAFGMLAFALLELLAGSSMHRAFVPDFGSYQDAITERFGNRNIWSMTFDVPSTESQGRRGSHDA